MQQDQLPGIVVCMLWMDSHCWWPNNIILCLPCPHPFYLIGWRSQHLTPASAHCDFEFVGSWIRELYLSPLKSQLISPPTVTRTNNQGTNLQVLSILLCERTIRSFVRPQQEQNITEQNGGRDRVPIQMNSWGTSQANEEVLFNNVISPSKTFIPSSSSSSSCRRLVLLLFSTIFLAIIIINIVINMVVVTSTVFCCNQR